MEYVGIQSCIIVIRLYGSNLECGVCEHYILWWYLEFGKRIGGFWLIMADLIYRNDRQRIYCNVKKTLENTILLLALIIIHN